MNTESVVELGDAIEATKDIDPPNHPDFQGGFE
jgi:hypothetical protein